MSKFYEIDVSDAAEAIREAAIEKAMEIGEMKMLGRMIDIECKDDPEYAKRFLESDDMCGCGHERHKHDFVIQDAGSPPSSTDACGTYECVTGGGCGTFEKAKGIVSVNNGHDQRIDDMNADYIEQEKEDAENLQDYYR